MKFSGYLLEKGGLKYKVLRVPVRVGLSEI